MLMLFSDRTALPSSSPAVNAVKTQLAKNGNVTISTQHLKDACRDALKANSSLSGQELEVAVANCMSLLESSGAVVRMPPITTLQSADDDESANPGVTGPPAGAAPLVEQKFFVSAAATNADLLQVSPANGMTNGRA